MIKKTNSNSSRYFGTKQEPRKILFNEGITQGTRFKTFLKVNTPNVFENKLILNLKKLQEVKLKMKIMHDRNENIHQSDYDLPLLKTEVNERITNLLNHNSASYSKTKDISLSGRLETEPTIKLIHPKKIIRNYLEREIFNENAEERDEYYTSMESRLVKRNSHASNMSMIHKVNNILGQFSFKNINLLEVKENLKRSDRLQSVFDLRLNNLNNLNNLNKNPSSKIKNHMTDIIISNSLTDRSYLHKNNSSNSSNLNNTNNNSNDLKNKPNNSSKKDKLFFNAFKKFNFDDRMKFALERNKMLYLTLRKSSNAIEKYKFIY